MTENGVGYSAGRPSSLLLDGTCSESNRPTAEFLAQLDLFLLSSTSEGFSIATIEAMAAGLPVVVTRCGGPEEIVTDDVTGVMTAAGDADALAAGLLALLADPGRRGRLAAAGREHARAQFSMDRMLAGYMELYQRLA